MAHPVYSQKNARHINGGHETLNNLNGLQPWIISTGFRSYI
jgi:hypothetical protein